MVRIYHLSYNSASNCHILLNKRFVSAKLYKILGVELFTLVLMMYVFSLQPRPQNRQVIMGVMGEMGWATALHGQSE